MFVTLSVCRSDWSCSLMRGSVSEVMVAGASMTVAIRWNPGLWPLHVVNSFCRQNAFPFRCIRCMDCMDCMDCIWGVCGATMQRIRSDVHHSTRQGLIWLLAFAHDEYYCATTRT